MKKDPYMHACLYSFLYIYYKCIIFLFSIPLSIKTPRLLDILEIFNHTPVYLALILVSLGILVSQRNFTYKQDLVYLRSGKPQVSLHTPNRWASILHLLDLFNSVSFSDNRRIRFWIFSILVINLCEKNTKLTIQPVTLPSVFQRFQKPSLYLNTCLCVCVCVCVCVCMRVCVLILFHYGGFFRLQDVCDILEGYRSKMLCF